MKEHGIQNEIRNELADRPDLLLFRANVGKAWTGDVTELPGKRVIIDNARRFSTGLPPGFSDLFGALTITITPEMVGQKVAIFTVMEVKPDGKYPTQLQKNFIQAVKTAGGRASVVRSVEDALRVVGGAA